MDDLKKFARYFRPYKLQLAIGIACIFGSTSAGLLIPLFVGQAIELGNDVGRSALLTMTNLAIDQVACLLLKVYRRYQ